MDKQDKLNFTKTSKQKEAISLFGEKIEVLLEGGSRAGKTFIIMYAIIVRAIKYPESKHLIVRKHFAHLKSIWYETLPDVIKTCFPEMKYDQNRTEWYISLSNKSMIWFGGTDDKSRIEKLLGWEWETIFINEGSQMPHDTYEVLKTRLNPMKGCKPLFLIDYNPPSKRHWGFKIFHEGKDPETNQPIKQPERYARIQMNPKDNIENLSETYLKTLESMSEKKRNRFLHGYYSDDSEGALWRRGWIEKTRLGHIPDGLERVVVGVDPAVTGKDTSDDTGIIVAGKLRIDGKFHFYIIDDMTIHGDVTGWGKEVVNAYKKYMADCVVGEVNQGGDLVEMNIRNYDRYIKFKSVRATRGKAKRAEPVADLYERGLVHHCGYFQDLEDMMCSWTPESEDSPDNMDAMVWAVSHLAGIGGDIKITRY